MTATQRVPSIRTALVVDDEPHVVELISDVLTSEGFAVTAAADGPAALRRARASQPDVVVLDIGLPGLDGYEVCRALRKEGPVPIVFVTARGAEVDRIVGLELGAADYVVKPFSPRELLARVRAVMRRAERTLPADCYSFGDVLVDFVRMEVSRDHKPVALTSLEFKLLKFFVANPERVLTRDELLNQV